MFEEYHVVFVLLCPQEGSENMRFIINVASSPPTSSQGHHAFSTPLCGASTSVSFVLIEFTFVLYSKRRCKTSKMFPKKRKTDGEFKKYN